MNIEIPLGSDQHTGLLGGTRAHGQREGPPPRFFSRQLRAQVRHPQPWLEQAAAVADDLAEAADRAALTAGRHLRMHRALRLGAMGYLLMVHVWILVLLMHMIPSMPEPPVRAAAAVSGKRLLHPGERM